MFCHDGIGTAAELRGGWAWTSDTSYYTWVKRDDTMFTNPIPLLKTVCWYDPVLSVKYVDPGSYSLFLRHGLQPNHNFVEKTNFTVKLQAKRKDTNELIKENTIYSTKKFMSEDEANHLVSLKCFDNTFICQFNTDNTYKLSQETDGEYFELVCSWKHADDWWKDGYIIDGVLLIPGQHSKFERYSTSPLSLADTIYSQNIISKVPVKDKKDRGKINKQEKPKQGIIGRLYGKISNITRPKKK